jgi:hypothetical protein
MAPPTADHRPLTGTLPTPVRHVILSTPPLGIEEHLVHGWDALQRAREGDHAAAEALTAAEHRAHCATALAEPLGERSPRRKLALEESEALLGAIAAVPTPVGEPGISFEEAVRAYVLEPLRAALGAARE